MLSLAELCKAIDKYAALAQNAYSLHKSAKLAVESPIYDKVSEDIFDSLSNQDFANLFEKYLNTYENLVNSLQISPQEFGKIINGGETQNENFADLFEPFKEAYDTLVHSPYIQQGIQDEGWEESSSPQEITAGIEELANDVWNRMYALGKSVGMRPSDVRGALEERQSIFDNEVQGRSEQVGAGGEREGAGTGMTAQEQEFRNRKIEKAREYSQSHRRRRSEGLAVGEKALTAQIQDLQTAISNETNGIKREELARRLQEKLDRLKLVTTYRNHQAKQLAKLKEPGNEAAYQKYLTDRKERKLDNHKYNFKFWDLIDAYKASSSPNDRARIKAEIVRLKKELMQRINPRLDFDSREAMYNTKIQDQLNPDKIIEAYAKRKAQRKTHWQEHHEKFKKNRAEGNLTGLLTDFNRSIAFDKSDVKKKINKALEKDPRVKSYIDRLAAAKKANDPAAVEAAAKAYSDFLDGAEYGAIREAHPIYQETIKAEVAMRDWRFKVKEIQTSKVLERESLDENTLATIRQVIDTGKALIATHTRNASINKQMRDIVTFLEDSIS